MEVVLPVSASWPKKRQDAALSGSELPTRKPDFDNYQKTVDALNLVVWLDDGQIVRSIFGKRYGEKPGTWIRVRPYQKEDIFG